MLKTNVKELVKRESICKKENSNFKNQNNFLTLKLSTV